MLEISNNGTTAVMSTPDSGSATLTLRYALRCHPGAVRSENQDRVFYTSTPLGELFIVADGVGGHADGALAAETVTQEYSATLQSAAPDANPQATLALATERANQQIATLHTPANGHADGAPPPMASTVVLALVRHEGAILGHLGDSRAYLLRDEALQLLTRDHSVVQRMVDAGILTPEQAKTHPSASVLTQCIGQPDAQLEIKSLPLQAEDILLLCSDGLWAFLPEEQLGAFLAAGRKELPATADALLAAVLAAGAPDNVGFAIVQLLPH